MASRHPSGAEESQRHLPYDSRGSSPGSDGRGDQYGGGHGQVPPPPPQAPGHAMKLSSIVHPEPEPALQAPGNVMNRSSTAYYEPQPPPPSAESYTYGHYPSYQPVPPGQLNWPPRANVLSEALGPLFRHLQGTAIEIEEINGRYKDSLSNRSLQFKASISYSRINITFDIKSLSFNVPAVAGAGKTAGKKAATVADAGDTAGRTASTGTSTEAGAGSNGEEPDGNPPGPASAEAS
ncbi:hypothetical protein FPCIR_10381 [Fusarium pseudocircinatum]|uniref:Uncharacterized protein n=1 Tax=Fusarium pseudocircinatum TaxID=56676 RepID=A0A8H5KX26_9HYPO|nr:hypothetical protein FPCIR_10381 [Fusarium pseudocircinatum]